jgi:hypothetical protein
MDRMFELAAPDKCNIIIKEAQSALQCGRGPFFRQLCLFYSTDAATVFQHSAGRFACVVILHLTSALRIERNDFKNPPFRASFVFFSSGKIQARCSKISADVSAMLAACRSIFSIALDHRSQIESIAVSGRRKDSPPPSAAASTTLRASAAVCYPKGA